jgi:hypothetical protein
LEPARDTRACDPSAVSLVRRLMSMVRTTNWYFPAVPE